MPGSGVGGGPVVADGAPYRTGISGIYRSRERARPVAPREGGADPALSRDPTWRNNLTLSRGLTVSHSAAVSGSAALSS
ncbi:hypothetical protein tb265_21960 [Gemmatimonadetes bacterium T265]|nr:hypothetical protein tb265_21960 [Gemmatimonadetes bacterium T265]